VGPPASCGIEQSLIGRPPLFDSLTPSDYVLIEALIEDEPARPAFAFSAWRHSLRRLARRGLRVLPVTEQVELGPDGEG
jgi:hypothetical protein